MNNPPVRIEYDPDNLLASVIGKLHLKNDADLSRALGVAPPVISKIRHRRTPVSASLLIRMCEATNLSIADLRMLMGDRRNTFRIDDRLCKTRAPGSDTLCAPPKTADRPGAWASAARDVAARCAASAHRTVFILGLLAIGLLGLILVKQHSADQFKQLPPLADVYRAGAATIAPAPGVISTAAPDVAAAAVADMGSVQQPTGTEQLAGSATSPQQKWVSRWLAKRYRVAGDAIHMLVSTTYQSATELKLDPLLILAVIAIESRFNPFSESPVGAQGLMQVMSKIHQEKFQVHGGVEAALDPVTNIKVGSRILKEYVAEGGSVEAGLRKYVGAAGFANDSGYGYRVLSEYRYLREVARGKQVPANVTAAATPPALTKTAGTGAPAALLPIAKDDPPQHDDPAQSADQVAAVQPLQ
jgi:soluble lytic murein transglycosylase-like protein